MSLRAPFNERATREMLDLVLPKRVRNGAKPVLRWMAGSSDAKQDPAGHIEPLWPGLK